MRNDAIWPTELRGDSRAVPWLNRLLRACKQSQICDIKVIGGTSKINNGTAIISMTPSSGGGGLNLRGEYDPTAVYNVSDMVVISTGINQGTFVCLASGVTGTPPYTGGVNWLQLPGGLLGQWY